MTERRKVGTAYAEFISEINLLSRLDLQNQNRYRAGPGRPSRSTLSKSQLFLITEGIFTRAFSSYERFLEETFLLYARGKPTMSGASVKTYLSPRSTVHAREIIKSHMNYLEWNSPNTIIKRCDIYLDEMNPLRNAMTAHANALGNMRKIRNAIAHRSNEAQEGYQSVLRAELRALPVRVPAPGEFLLMTNPRTPKNYFLVSYLDTLKDVASTAAA